MKKEREIINMVAKRIFQERKEFLLIIALSILKRNNRIEPKIESIL